MQKRQTLITYCVMLLLMLQPVLVVAKHSCQNEGSSAPQHSLEHDHMGGVAGDKIGSMDHDKHGQCDCGCYCGGVCIQACSTMMLPVVTAMDSLASEQRERHLSTPLLLAAHAFQHLRPPNYS